MSRDLRPRLLRWRAGSAGIQHRRTPPNKASVLSRVFSLKFALPVFEEWAKPFAKQGALNLGQTPTVHTMVYMTVHATVQNMVPNLVSSVVQVMVQVTVHSMVDLTYKDQYAKLAAHMLQFRLSDCIQVRSF